MEIESTDSAAIAFGGEVRVVQLKRATRSGNMWDIQIPVLTEGGRKAWHWAHEVDPGEPVHAGEQVVMSARGRRMVIQDRAVTNCGGHNWAQKPIIGWAI